MSKRNLQEDYQNSGLIVNSPPRKRLCQDAEGEDARGHVATASTRLFTHDDYTVGWVCALPLEMAAAVAMLDEIHTNHTLEKHPNDNNTYTLGGIGKHNIVIACLPLGVYGTISATTVASQMSATFTSISFWLMVGIGGGVPSAKVDIRLGDIVVSTGVIQYDYGKTVSEGRFERTGALNKPPQTLLTAISKLQADHRRVKSRIPEYLSEMLNKHPDMAANYTHRGQEQDILFEAEYDHVESEDTCRDCNRMKLVPRNPRVGIHPVVHYGLVASGNQVMKHGGTRDYLGRELGIICFEMEAAGLMDSFPCLVIRGICDYSDSHKNKQWQEYSAATAAAYVKELLFAIPAARSMKTLVINTVVTPEVIERRQSFMDALRFNQIDARQATIKSAHAKTCKWLLTKPEYRDWLDPNLISEHHGFLWIKGKPGTGKSTIMKFALKHSEKTIKETPILSFFFNARGEDLEKSTTGMYRSLLYQLLKKIPELQSVFDSMGSPPTPGASDPWDIEILKETFGYALEKFGQQRLICFIDALDECGEDQVRDMIGFFEDLGQLAISSRIHLNVCFSSRHYPYITIKQGKELVLEGQEGHEHDIVNYLHSELKVGHSKQVEEIRTEILQKASGIFLWVVLAVQILNKEYDRGRLHALRKRLKEIPTKLNELFKDILTRDAQNMEDLLICIQWILYAKRPLKLVELYFAILASESSEYLGVWNPEETTKEDMGRFILSSSKGLAEVTKSADQIVQFIHESVRDFLLKDNGLKELWAEFGVLNSHDRLKKCCHNYIKIDMSQDLPLHEPLPTASTREASELRQLASSKFPFLEYAVRNILYHAELAENSGSPQESFIDNFPLMTWSNLNNLLERYQIRRHTSEVSLLYILAEQNLPNLSKIQLKRTRTMDIRGERYNYPLYAALFNGNREVIRALLMPDTDPQSETYIPQNLCVEYLQELDAFIGNWPINTKVPKDQSPLFYVAHHRKWGIVTLLLTTGKVNVISHYKTKAIPVLEAIEAGQDAVVRLFIKKGATLDHSKNGLDAISIAAAKGHKAVVKLLTENGEMLWYRSEYATPLSYAVIGGHTAVVDFLLNQGFPPDDGNDGWYGIPLCSAAERGYAAVVKLLLDKGANPEYRRFDRTALCLAVYNEHTEVVELLLQKGANPSDIYNDGDPTLCDFGRTINKRYEVVVRLLLENGVELESISHDWALLPAAARDGNETLVKMLVENGAKLEARSSRNGTTALSYAAMMGRYATTKLLLEHGAEIESMDNIKQTPLSHAASFGYTKIVELLLEHGADTESMDFSGRTPLSYAASCGSTETTKLLLEHGADTESMDIGGHNPLSYATDYGHTKITELLREHGADTESMDIGG